MRTLLALAIIAGTVAWSAPDADAGRRSWRSAQGGYRAAPQRYYLPRGNGVCQSRARFFDPNGTFRGFPCWAREAFGQGRR